MNDLKLVQGTSEWLEMRKLYLGASDAPIVAGISPFDSPYSLWLDKLGFSEPKYESEAMKRGKELEPIARAVFCQETGFMMLPEVVFSNEYNFMMASLDGIDGQNIVELKCPSSESVHQIALDGEIPEYYKPQLLHQCIVAKVPKVYYFSYTPESWKILEYHYNEAEAKKLISAETEFWNCVQTLEPPKLSDRDYQIRVDEEWKTKAKALKEMIAKRKVAEFEEEQLKQELIELAQGQNSKGGGISVCKIVKKGNIQYKNIPELKEVDLEKHRSTSSTYWRIN